MIDDYLHKNLNTLTKVQVKEKRGIYFLYDRDELVYIGQSIHMKARIYKDHIKSDKIFDSYRYIEVDKNTELDRLELLYILEYNPRYNKNSLGKGTYSSDLTRPKKFSRKKKATKVAINVSHNGI